MNNSPMHLRSSVVMLTIITAISLLFLVQCNESKVDDFGFRENIEEHFGDMNYGKTVFAKEISSSNKIGVEYQRGNGIFKDGKGKELSYKWAFLLGENGQLLTGYIGTSNMTSTVAVELTRDETKDALRRCSAKDDINEVFACFDRVVATLISDCQSSMSIDECRAACWYDLDQCRPLSS